MIVVELRKMFRRPRTWATIAVLNSLPILVAFLLVGGYTWLSHRQHQRVYDPRIPGR